MNNKVGKLTGMPIGWNDTKFRIAPDKSDNEVIKQGTFEEPIGVEIEELIKIIETPSIVDDLRNQFNEKTSFKTDLCSESYIYRLKKSRYSYNYPVFTFYRIHTSYFITYNHEKNIWRFIGTGRH